MMKPCPFCGSVDLRTSTNIKIEQGKVINEIVCVQCMFFGCDGPKKLFGGDPVERWNEREGVK